LRGEEQNQSEADMQFQFQFQVLLLLVVVAIVSSFQGRFGLQRGNAMKLNMADSEKLGKSEMVDIISDKMDITKKQADEFLNAFMETVKEQVLDNGNEIRLREFGTFKQKVTSARVGRNPRTGEELQIAGGKSVAWSVSSALKVKATAAGKKPAAAKPAAKAAAKPAATKKK